MVLGICLSINLFPGGGSGARTVCAERTKPELADDESFPQHLSRSSRSKFARKDARRPNIAMQNLAQLSVRWLGREAGGSHPGSPLNTGSNLICDVEIPSRCRHSRPLWMRGRFMSRRLQYTMREKGEIVVNRYRVYLGTGSKASHQRVRHRTRNIGHYTRRDNVCNT